MNFLGSLSQSIKNFYDRFNSQEKIILGLWMLVTLYTVSDRVTAAFYAYPHAYKWQELFISWAGGVIRRGLLGEFFSLFNPDQLRCSIICIFMALYILWYAYFIKLLAKIFDHFWLIILLGAPTIGSFVFQAEDEFLRRDIFIYFYIALSFWIIIKLHVSKKFALSLLCVAALFGFFLLVHELTLLYSGFAFILIWSLYPDRRKTTFIFFTALVIFALLFLFNFGGTVESREAIYNFWESRIPGFRPIGNTFLNAIDFVGLGLFEKPSYAMSTPYLIDYKFRSLLIKCFLLTFIPIVLLYRAYDFHNLHKSLFGLMNTAFFYLLALLIFVAIVCIMNDFGRIFSDYAIYLVLYLAAVLELAKSAKIESSTSPRFNLRDPALFILAFCYIFLWCMRCDMPRNPAHVLIIQSWQAYLLG